MGESLLSRILTKLGIAILVIAFADLAYVNWWIIKSQESRVKSQSLEEERIVSQALQSSNPPSPSSSSPIASSSLPETKTVETKTIVETPNQSGSGQASSQTIVQTAQKEIFIPMGSGSTNGSTFTDLSGTDVTIDTSKYSAIESVVFEASVWVEGGNGRAYAQITNLTDKNPLIESQISNNTGSGVVKASGKIPIPSGQKTYRVQAKTDITNFAAHVDNARIKITLK